MKIPYIFIRAVSAALALSLGGCVSMDAHRSNHPDPHDRLDQLLGLYQQQRADGSACDELWRAARPTVDCQRIQKEVERLSLEFPRNARVSMANATLQYEAGRLDKAQFSLDQILSTPGSHPEAALLRSRIAMQEGNSSRARALLIKEISLRPDYPELREALAASYYLEGKYAQAQSALSIAGRLGAPGWRVSYHQGLIQEARKSWSAACRYYLFAIEQRRDFSPPAKRLLGLSHHEECREFADLRFPAKK